MLILKRLFRDVECSLSGWSLCAKPDLISAAFSSSWTDEFQVSLLMQIFCTFDRSESQFITWSLHL